MAEDEIVKEQEITETPKKKKSWLLPVGIIVVLLGSIVGGAGYGYLKIKSNLANRSEADQAELAPPPAVEAELAKAVDAAVTAAEAAKETAPVTAVIETAPVAPPPPVVAVIETKVVPAPKAAAPPKPKAPSFVRIANGREIHDFTRFNE